MSSTPAPTEPQPSKATRSRSGRNGRDFAAGKRAMVVASAEPSAATSISTSFSSAAWIALAWISPLLAFSASA